MRCTLSIVQLAGQNLFLPLCLSPHSVTLSLHLLIRVCALQLLLQLPKKLNQLVDANRLKLIDQALESVLFVVAKVTDLSHEG